MKQELKICGDCWHNNNWGKVNFSIKDVCPYCKNREILLEREKIYRNELEKLSQEMCLESMFY
ncbi:MAG: hypothetical protein LBF97_01150 [Elusimicrobiota bacterium]|jgi:DNA-directed RNA polymerase subunit RPC12/RpoP|nr:hypothetical protein [Elusimicrobiota bacterium]